MTNENSVRVTILNGYRGKIVTREEYWPKGERDVTPEQAEYLVTNGHAQYATSSAEARRNPSLQRFVGQDTSVAVSVDNVFAAMEGLTDAQLIELGAQNNLTIPRTATREQAIRALVTFAVRPGANLVISPALKGAPENDLLPRNEADRQFVAPGNNALPTPEERDRLLSRGLQPLSDLEYSALSADQKLAYERARQTTNVEGVDKDLGKMTKAELIEYGASRNVALNDEMTKAEMLESLKGK
jgi:hypothetical protein